MQVSPPPLHVGHPIALCDVCVALIIIIASRGIKRVSVAPNLRTGLGMKQSRSRGTTKSIQSIVHICEDLTFCVTIVLSCSAAEFGTKVRNSNRVRDRGREGVGLAPFGVGVGQG